MRASPAFIPSTTYIERIGHFAGDFKGALSGHQKVTNFVLSHRFLFDETRVFGCGVFVVLSHIG